MPRLYVPPERLVASHVQLEDDEAGYLVRVRRLQPGDAVEVFDGVGTKYAATLEPGGRSLLTGPGQKSAAPSRFRFELWQALPKSSKFEWILQKATELGAARIVPMTTERVVVRVPAAQAGAKLARWRKVAAEAARQCGRADVPEVAALATFDGLFAARDTGTRIALAYEHERELALTTHLRAVRAGERVAIAIGPEGGFAISEVERALAAGAVRVGLGPLILRTETAALVACALAQQAAWGLG